MKFIVLLDILSIVACGGICINEDIGKPAVDNNFVVRRIVKLINTWQMLEQRYSEGYRTFECDINKTLDGHYVLIHDFEVFKKVPTLDEFITFRRKSRHSNITLDELIRWLNRHPEVIFIIDCKENSSVLDILEYMSGNGKMDNLKRQIIPQVFSPDEFNLVQKRFKCKDIIWSLYRKHYDDDEILCWVAGFEKSFAIAMQLDRALISSLPCRLKDLNIPTIVFTVDDYNIADSLRENCVSEFYTTTLLQ